MLRALWWVVVVVVIVVVVVVVVVVLVLVGVFSLVFESMIHGCRNVLSG